MSRETTEALVDVEVVESPMSLMAPPQHILATMAQREIEASIVLARQFPRDESACYQILVRSCRRSGFAERAEYRYPRGGNTVQGPSVYFAREAAKIWGNLKTGFSIIEDTEESRTIRCFAWDLETNYNTYSEDQFKKLVQRRRGGETIWEKPDERDLRELTNKRAAILERNCILRIIPEDIRMDAIEETRRTRQSQAAQDPDKTRKDILKAFDSLNIPSEDLDLYLGTKIAQASPQQLVQLREVFFSVRDGNSTWREHLSAVVEARVVEGGQAPPSGEPLPGARSKSG